MQAQRSRHHESVNMKILSRRMPIELLPLLGIGFGVVLATALTTTAINKIGEFQGNAEWVEHTQQVRFDLERVAHIASDAQAAVRGFLLAGQPTLLKPFDEAKTNLPQLMRALAIQVSDNPSQKEHVTRLAATIDASLRAMQSEVQSNEQASIDAAASDTKSTAATHATAKRTAGSATGDSADDAIRQIHSQTGAMQAIEEALLQQRERELAHRNGAIQRLLEAGTAIVFFVFGGTFLLLSREIRRRRKSDVALNIANADLVKHAEVLELTNKELESFSYSVSHDLRIPLRAVSGYSHMLAEDYDAVLDDEGKRLLGVIRENSNKMGVLIDDLLAFSKLGRQTLTVAEIDMQALVANVLAELCGPDHDDHATITFDKLPTGWGDRALLRQIWINLISNALKYSRKRSDAKVHISGECTDVECTYSVSDNGAGFDMAYYDKLFGVFQRLHSQDEFPGTGVGLAIVQRIVVRHGGHLWATGAVNLGATFMFTLPCKPAASA